ncbi:MAG: OmpH family outer membrane protein [Candidatus Latescibacteria bacterium]|nr:OmpH family outer membrane protein [Candidatus Latescibacterota bacterium]MCK5329472.1 OmpH family outer membrane protein [Candidatus Latescibacterota bacterium]MCK5527381.1 OmpH family outer membrane protein [Candidatus Latescibacterota bacterium]MCK5733881.1 OmpH family outer membrane protein [Candidatus Latescibacterota bacterium]
MGIKTWIVASLLFGLMGGFSEDASAKDLKLGYIDSNRILTEYKGMADVQAELEKAKLEWDKQTQTREAELDNLREEYDAQSLMWSEKTQQQKQQAIQEKYAEYQRFVNEIIAPGGKFAQRREELLLPIYNKINTILDQVGKEGDYDFILDVAIPAVVFAKPEYELTDRVLEELNKEME